MRFIAARGSGKSGQEFEQIKEYLEERKIIRIPKVHPEFEKRRDKMINLINKEVPK